jgi:RNA polymerase primary sigma factor
MRRLLDEVESSYDREEVEEETIVAERDHSSWQQNTETRLLTADEEVVLAKRVQQGDLDAKQRMIEANLRLVISIAKRYRCKSMAFEDLVQEGIIGLMAAVTRYDPQKGYRFSTYATHWIRQAIGRAIDNQGRMIRLPSHVSDAVRKLERSRMALTRRLGRQPTVEELADEAKLPAKKVSVLLQSAQEPLSLDALLGEGEETPLGDLLLDLQAPDPENSTIRARNREALEDILQVLRPRERRVIEKRFGFSDGRVYSLQEVGDQLQMSREGVRQIEVRALKKLKQAVSTVRPEDYTN